MFLYIYIYVYIYSPIIYIWTLFYTMKSIKKNRVVNNKVLCKTKETLKIWKLKILDHHYYEIRGSSKDPVSGVS